jgi:hypothetical protein
VPVPWPAVANQLGLTAEEAEELRGYLVWSGCLEANSPLREVTLTPAAVSYLERECGRRRSIRPRVS